MLLAGVLAVGAIFPPVVTAGWPWRWFGANRAATQSPGSSLAPALHPVPPGPWPATPSPSPPGPKPYFGQALGATYYNWGYFGAHRHAQLRTHADYEDNTYREHGHQKGY